MTYKIYNSDCIEGSKTYLANDSIDLLIADPPFNLAFNGTTHTKDKKRRFYITANDNLPMNEYRRFSVQWLTEAYRVLKPRRHLYVFIDWRMYPYMSIWIKRAGFLIKNLIVWDKERIGLGHHYRFQHELLIFAVKSKDRHRRTHCRKTSDIWRIPKVLGNRLEHPYQKPVELMDKIVLNSSDEGELVADFFAGRGTVLKSCMKNSRKNVSFEIDRSFYGKIIEDIQK